MDLHKKDKKHRKDNKHMKGSTHPEVIICLEAFSFKCCCTAQAPLEVNKKELLRWRRQQFPMRR
eukprot:8427364-Lingulodinium_polyedra.AAC.1